MWGQGTGISLSRATSPDVAIKVAFIVDWTAISTAGVGADVIISLVVFVSISLRALRLGDDVLASVLALQESLKVVIVSLTASVIEDFTGTGNGIVPVATDGLLTVSQTEGL